MLTLLLGGARSGKSSLAIAYAARTIRPVTFIATGEARDEEFAERIERHRLERPRTWTTREEPLELNAALDTVPNTHAVIIDCLTLWVANLLDRGFAEDAIVQRTDEVVKSASMRSGPTIAVSNEVGSGIVPIDATARRYRDVLGRVNSAFALSADMAYLVVAGRTIRLDPPVDFEANVR